MLAAILPILGSIGGQIAKSVFPDPAEETKRQELEQSFQRAIIEHSSAIEQAAASIVKTEAASPHWLAANWRPITALIFVALIVAHWTGYTAPNMSEAERLAVYDIIKIMIGGYVVSRGAEKVVDRYKSN
jgi:hypothetical protein